MNNIRRRLRVLENLNKPSVPRLIPVVVGNFGTERIEYREIPEDSFVGISDTDLLEYAQWKCDLFKNIAPNRKIEDFEN